MSDPLKQTPECELDRDNAVVTEREQLELEIAAWTTLETCFKQTTEAVERIVDRAVATERERCAKLCEDMAGKEVRNDIAAALETATNMIRKGE